MTADEIKETDESCKTEKGWMREIALQLAYLNQRAQTPPVQGLASMQLNSPGCDPERGRRGKNTKTS